MRLRTEAVLWLLFLTVLYLLVRTARAEEPPCRRAGADVICTATGLKVLTDRIIDTDAALKGCRRELTDAQGRVTTCRQDCEALSTPVPPAPITVTPVPTSATKAVTGAALVAIGAAGVVLASTLLDVGVDWRAGLATAGVASISLGVVLVLP